MSDLPRLRSAVPYWVALILSLACGRSFAQDLPPPGECPQPRFTGRAPDDYYFLQNPLQVTQQRLKSGERSYQAGRISCATCHGMKGDGKGPLSGQFVPRPRNFACAQTVRGIPDGQLFWITRYGSPGTAMPAHPEFDDEQIWQIVLYLRQLAQLR
jgi:cytochrome c553